MVWVSSRQGERLGPDRVWRLALATFVVAASTGLVLRLVPLVGAMPGLEYANIRHAHSHLMYFGWATPLLMALVAAGARGGGRRDAPGSGRIVGTTFVVAWASYLPFLVAGYDPIVVGGVRLPVSVVAATLNVAAWWWFAAWYARARRGRAGDPGRWLVDGAVGLLVAASVGALSRGVVGALGTTDPLALQAPIHAFLDLFVDGWVLLAVLGLAWWALAPTRSLARWVVPTLVVGVVPTFLLTLSPDLLPGSVRAVAATISIAGLVALGKVVGALWPATTARPAWRFVLVLVAVRLVAGAVVVVPAWASWALGGGLRVLHLHVMGLGVLTGGLVAAAVDRDLLPARQARHWRVAVTSVLASLVLLTDLWPTTLGGPWVRYVVAAAASLPLAAAIASLVVDARSGRSQGSGAGGHHQAVDRSAQALVGVDLTVDTFGPVDVQTGALEVGPDAVGRDQAVRVGRAADAVGEVGQVMVDDQQSPAGGDRGRRGTVG